MADVLTAVRFGNSHSAKLVGGLVVMGVEVEGEAADGLFVENGGEVSGGGGIVAGEGGGFFGEAFAEDFVAEGEDVVDGAGLDLHVHGREFKRIREVVQ